MGCRLLLRFSLFVVVLSVCLPLRPANAQEPAAPAVKPAGTGVVEGKVLKD